MFWHASRHYPTGIDPEIGRLSLFAYDPRRKLPKTNNHARHKGRASADYAAVLAASCAMIAASRCAAPRRPLKPPFRHRTPPNRRDLIVTRMTSPVRHPYDVTVSRTVDAPRQSHY